MDEYIVIILISEDNLDAYTTLLILSSLSPSLNPKSELDNKFKKLL